MSHDSNRAFLSIVTKHLNFNDPTGAIDEFLSRSPSPHLSLLKDLLGTSNNSSNSDPYGTPFGLAFYKSIVNDRRLFKVPTSCGTTVLQKQKTPSDSAQASFTEAGTYTVLGISDIGRPPPRRSTSADIMLQKMSSVRESVISSNGAAGSLGSSDTDGGAVGGTHQATPSQYMVSTTEIFSVLFINSVFI